MLTIYPPALTSPPAPALSHATLIGPGVYAIDTGFQGDGFDAAFLIVHGGRAAFIDSGTQPGLPRLLGTLSELGLSTDAVEWVIATHVHLDHAGAVGGLMSTCPQARLCIHPRGARHMIDPSALWAGATAVYGEAEMRRSYGELIPVPADRVMASEDGQVIHLADRPLTLLHTPGHALHHHCIWDPSSQGVFTGDTLGLCYRQMDLDTVADEHSEPFIILTTTPVQFDPEAMKASITRLLGLQPTRAYFTHFGCVHGQARLQAMGQRLIRETDVLVELARATHADHPGDARHEALVRALRQHYRAALLAHFQSGNADADVVQARVASAETLLTMDVTLNAQGLGIWLDRAMT